MGFLNTLSVLIISVHVFFIYIFRRGKYIALPTKKGLLISTQNMGTYRYRIYIARNKAMLCATCYVFVSGNTTNRLSCIVHHVQVDQTRHVIWVTRPRKVFCINRIHSDATTVNRRVKELEPYRNVLSIAKELVGRCFGGLRVFNLNCDGKDVAYTYYEVIMIDPHHNVICRDPTVN